MKNIVDVLKQKEAEIQQLQVEVEALRVAMRILSEDGDNHYGLALAAASESRDSNLQEIGAGSARQFP